MGIVGLSSMPSPMHAGHLYAQLNARPAALACKAVLRLRPWGAVRTCHAFLFDCLQPPQPGPCFCAVCTANVAEGCNHCRECGRRERCMPPLPTSPPPTVPFISAHLAASACCRRGWRPGTWRGQWPLSGPQHRLLQHAAEPELCLHLAVGRPCCRCCVGM